MTDPSMPSLLKVAYVFRMWAGRLEFVAVFAFLGFIYALLEGEVT